MAVIHGVLTQLITPFDGKRQNRWWVAAESWDDALDRGVSLVNIIKNIFGNGNVFNNIHVWRPNTNPNEFRNRAISISGTFTSAFPTNAVPCVKVSFNADSASYPNTKYFRVGVPPTAQTGRAWGTDMTVAISDMLEALSELSWLIDVGGDPVGNWSADPFVQYRQLSKKWYNRGT